MSRRVGSWKADRPTLMGRRTRQDRRRAERPDLGEFVAVPNRWSTSSKVPLPSAMAGLAPYCAGGSAGCASRMLSMAAAVLKSTSSTWNTRSELAGIGPDSRAP